MRQWFYKGGMYCQDRIKEVRQPYAVGFGNQSEKTAVAIKTPGPPCFNHFEAVFVILIKKFVRHTPGWIFKSQLQRF